METFVIPITTSAGAEQTVAVTFPTCDGVERLLQQAESQLECATFMSDKVESLYGVFAATIACQFALAELLEAEAHMLRAQSVYVQAYSESFLCSGDMSMSEVKHRALATLLFQQSIALQSAKVLWRQATNILAHREHNSPDDDEPVAAQLNQISEAIFELVDVDKVKALSHRILTDGT